MLLLAFAFWLLAHPYTGIRHDGKLYALQALYRLDPGRFANDLFLRYGSQDQYSFFSTLYAAAIGALGLIAASGVLQALATVFWLASLVVFARVVAGRQATLAIMLVLLTSSFYGSHLVFSYGEAFVTARPWAEALSLLGLAAWMRERWLAGALALVAAALLHPLMALPAVLIGLALRLPPRLWLVLLPLGAAAAWGLGALGIAPFTGLVLPMDRMWWEAVAARSPFVFVHTWTWTAHSQTLYLCAVLALGWRAAPDPVLRRLAAACLVSVVAAFALALVGGSLLKLPLIAALQVTRVLWIAKIVALIVFAVVFWQHRNGTFWNRLLVWGFAFIAFVEPWAQAVLAALVLGASLAGKQRAPDYVAPRRIGFILATMPVLFIVQWSRYVLETDWERVFAAAEIWRVFWINPGLALIFAALGAGLLAYAQRTRWHLVAGVGASAVLAFALLRWYALPIELDHDDPARRAAIAPAQRTIPANALVYWVDEPDQTWFWLGRASYLSLSQTAGAIFQRATTVEALRRAKYVQAASSRDSSQRWPTDYARYVPRPVAAAAAKSVCADPVLDFVIARVAPSRASSSQATSGQAASSQAASTQSKSSQSKSSQSAASLRDPATGRVYAVYACAVVRAQAAPETAVIPRHRPTHSAPPQ